MRRYSWLLLGLVGAVSVPVYAQAKKGLVVVAPDALRDAVAEFVKFKSEQLPTELVSLQEVLKSSGGVDDPERLKRFLFSRWKEKQIGYVLLVGDADVMPVRYMVLDRVTKEAFDYSFYASDLYYADLAKADGSFEDWNAQKEGFHARYFGEVRGEKNKEDPINYDQVHYVPEVAVGRWPVSTAAQAKLVAEKSMRYERGVLSGEKTGMSKAAMFAIGGWVDARGAMDQMAGMLSGKWEVSKWYYADQRRNDHTEVPNEKAVVGVLNSGAGLVMHTGHGTNDMWEQCFSIKSLKAVKNEDRLPVMISAGCSTAVLANEPPYTPYLDEMGKEHEGTRKKEVFDSPPPAPAAYQTGRFNETGLGEALVRGGPNGAVAYIGCNTGSQPCGLTLLMGFAATMQKEKEPRLGDCWAGAVTYYFEHERLAKLVPNSDWYPPSIFFQAMKFVVFGDPSMRLPGEREGK